MQWSFENGQMGCQFDHVELKGLVEWKLFEKMHIVFKCHFPHDLWSWDYFASLSLLFSSSRKEISCVPCSFYVMYKGSYSNPHGMHSIVENQNDMSGYMSKERFASNEISSKKNYPTNDHGKIFI